MVISRLLQLIKILVMDYPYLKYLMQIYIYIVCIIMHTIKYFKNSINKLPIIYLPT
jgi:hypothetical protein